MASSSFVCALSGQPIASNEDAVVTPSGQVCLKNLLLSKLTENGGSDPFTREPLDEDRLIKLASSSLAFIPPRSCTTSMPSLLNSLNTEYSNLVLELFDTRSLLEETRKELSQALYQNDASVRVVARLSRERDAARHELASWTKKNVTAPTDNEGPLRKRARVSTSEESSGQTAVIPNSISTSQLEIMVETWKSLSKNRKEKRKQVTANAPSKDDLKDFSQVAQKAYHKASGKQGIIDMMIIGEDNLILSLGKDRKIYLFDGKQVIHSFTTGNLIPTFINAVKQDLIAVASLREALLLIGDKRVEIHLAEDMVDLSVHPSNQHVVIATTTRINLYSSDDGGLLTYFDCSDSITCGALHPDGLIYAVGTVKGKMELWDFKSQNLASTLGAGGEAIRKIVFSNNGYHVASLAGNLSVWDLKKQSSLIELGNEKDELQSMTFDPSGKYLAYGGNSGIAICAVKEWTKLVELDNAISHLAWGKFIVSSSRTDRGVRFYGLKAE